MATRAVPEILGPRKVLVVDDDPLVAMTLELLLQADGHHVASVGKAEEALARLRESKYDLVITDLSLGQTDGLGLAREIKRLFPNQPVVLSSGSPELLSNNPAGSPEIDFFLAKPFGLDDLREALARSLHRPA